MTETTLRKMIDRLENYYGFRCEDGGALRDCLEWQQLRDAALAGAHVDEPPAVVGVAADPRRGH